MAGGQFGSEASRSGEIPMVQSNITVCSFAEKLGRACSGRIGRLLEQRRADCVRRHARIQTTRACWDAGGMYSSAVRAVATPFMPGD